MNTGFTAAGATGQPVPAAVATTQHTQHTHRSLITMDVLDDRREVWSLLHRLSPRARVSFLAWCCEKVKRPDGNGPVASSRMHETVEGAYRCDRFDLRLTNECYADLFHLACQWHLDLAVAAVELEKRVKAAGRKVAG